jgi:hypothetical protein
VANVLAKPTNSGRFLLSATDKPLTPEQCLEMAADMKGHPEAQEKLHELSAAAKMGLKLRYAKSPAFIGLLIVDLQSAELPGFKNPEIQFVCEDDKVCTAELIDSAWSFFLYTSFQCFCAHCSRYASRVSAANEIQT